MKVVLYSRYPGPWNRRNKWWHGLSYTVTSQLYVTYLFVYDTKVKDLVSVTWNRQFLGNKHTKIHIFDDLPYKT